MRDAALNLLIEALQHSDSEQAVFLADENVDTGSLQQLARSMPVITNRHDLFTALPAGPHKHVFSDFDLSACHDASLQQVYYRTSKEKPVVHHVINTAARILTPGGKLFIAGDKQQGIQTYIKKAEQRLGKLADITRDGAARLGVIARNHPGPALDDSDYSTLRIAVHSDHLAFYSKPGVFGWNKIDQGSALLSSHLDQLDLENRRVLDLGCGYGYLSVMAWQYAPAFITACDNNAAALLACTQNFKHHGITGDVIADDAGTSLHNRYDVILCNPPFHQGFDVERDLTHKFTANSARLLNRDGSVLFVVNSFIPLEKIAATYFDQVNVMTNTRQFKLVLCQKPKHH